jgi:aryl-alcohol dehydrogenase-like predicted oxidoreductase
MHKLVLGTAQLGLPRYGRTNLVGRPRRQTAVALIRRGVSLGIDAIDTARDYGTAESVVGAALDDLVGGKPPVVTKLSSLRGLPGDADRRVVREAVDASVTRSCKELRAATLPVLLLHRWAHHEDHEGAIWARLLELRDEGLIQRLGASVYSPEEALEALADPEVEHVQLPFNILDRRWVEAGVDRAAAKRPDVVVHARSVLLQGILGAGPTTWPEVAGVDPADIIARMESLVRETGRISRVDLCLAYASGMPWIHGLVVGAETEGQLIDLARDLERPSLDPRQLDLVARALPPVPGQLLNPSLWPAQR